MLEVKDMTMTFLKMGIARQIGAKLIIFDLDRCIFDTNSMGAHVINPVLAVLHASNLPEEAQRHIETDLWQMSFRDIVQKYNIPRDLARAMQDAYKTLAVPDSAGTYGDENHILRLPPYMARVLVTSGYRHFQENKITKLGIAHLFDRIVIDAIDDPEIIEGKRTIFARLMDEYGVRAREVLIVGDSDTSELKAGRDLGMVTVQTLRPGINRSDNADFHIFSLYEL